MVTGGLSWLFYTKQKSEDSGPDDSDGDGIPDSQDACPDTPRGINVDGQGCEMDSDHDGVLDSKDDCPDTPEGAPVDQKGCPTDTDKDGVFDYKDECPDTPPGTKVGLNGCKQPERVEINMDIKYPVGKAHIEDAFIPEVDKVIRFMKTYPDSVAEIGGHTDNTGSATYNFHLSQKRADNVRKMLIERGGISSDRVTAKGYGPSVPAATNSTPKGRRQNRRTVATVTAVDE